VDYESLVEAAYTAVLRAGDAAVDVGAHTGRHAIPMARLVGPTGHVFAFEPLPTCRDILAQNLASVAAGGASLASVDVRPDALSNRSGTAEFNFTRQFPEYSGLRERVYDHPVDIETLQVTLTRLDDLLSGFPRIALVKIDAEGGEHDIVDGARELLRRDRPVVTFEFGDNALVNYETTALDMHRLLAEEGYSVMDILGDPLDEASFVESSAVQRVWDYVAVPADAEELREAVVQGLAARRAALGA
jgi:FkbM family methyltransferase